tara:strand:- start:939 stop:1574 length:636 start_codon:yes stop_codon:yes gene_type:complete
MYLHGLASSPNSIKGMAFKNFFDSLQLNLTIPDLEAGEFENLTITGQMKIITNIMNRYSTDFFGLIGSSLGGYLAALSAEIQPQVKAVYLMAPAFGFLNRWREKLRRIYGNNLFPELIEIYHYHYKENRNLNTGIFRDAENWSTLLLKRELPIRLIHGLGDDSVPIEESRKFVKSRMNIQFCELDSDHGLLSHLDWIIDDCVNFFQEEGLI